MTNQRVPADVEAEMCVLGSVVLKPICLDEVAQLLRPEDFFDAGHLELFSAMLAVQSNGKPVDAAVLSAELRHRGTWESVGGAVRLAKIARAVPHAGHALSYAEIVKDKSVRRQVLTLADKVGQMAWDPSNKLEEITAGVNSLTTQMLEGTQRSRTTDMGDCAIELLDRLDRGEMTHQRGYQTPFAPLNDLTNGIMPGLVVVGARPSVGKSAFLLNLAVHTAERENKAVGIFSLEMLASHIAQRAISLRSRVPRKKWDKPSPEERQSIADGVARLGCSRVLIEDRPSISAGEICAQVRLWSRQHDLAFVAIDYLQLVRPDNPKDNRDVQLGKISRQLKMLSMELELPVIAASQLNRQGEDGRPSLHHLRESGNIEQDTDVVMFLWREQPKAAGGSSRFNRRSEPEPEPEPENPDDPKKIKLTIAKQRDGEVNRDIDLMYHGAQFRFEEACPVWLQEREQEAESFGFQGGF